LISIRRAYFMKKTILTLSGATVVLVLLTIINHFILKTGNISGLIIFNLILPTIALIIANGIINFDAKFNLKKCLLSAIALAVIPLAISLVYTQVFFTDIENLLSSQNESIPSSIQDELYDELDRQAREKMIEEGLIDEDEEIYAGDYSGGAADTDSNNTSDEELTAEWDVQIVKADGSTYFTDVILNIMFALAGGFIGHKIKQQLCKKRKIC